MITPSYTSPISTLQQVLDSGLPWGMVLYGEEEEEMMAKSKDPVIKRIWNEKYVEEYAPIPKVHYNKDMLHYTFLAPCRKWKFVNITKAAY